MIHFFRQLKIALVLLISLTILTGIIYPLFITLLAQVFFHESANGRLIIQDNQVIGSELIGQSFTQSKYFWGRPSATSPYPYNATASSGSNLGPSNPNLLNTVKERAENIRKHSDDRAFIPVDLVTASASGLDPEISPLAAFYQVSRIAKTRGLSVQVIHKLIENSIRKRFLGVLGEPRVNVLKLNLALDRMTSQGNQHARTSKP